MCHVGMLPLKLAHIALESNCSEAEQAIEMARAGSVHTNFNCSSLGHACYTDERVDMA